LKTSDFTYLLNNTDAISERETSDLERVLLEFPYFQSAAALRLKGLHSQNDFRYNSELKKIASQTTSRSVLYDLIVTESFSADFLKNIDLYDIEVVDPEILPYQPTSTGEKSRQSIMFSIETSQIKNIETNDQNQAKEPNQTDSEKLEQSILFSIETSQIENLSDNQENTSAAEGKSTSVNVYDSDRFSFTKWLQLTQNQSIAKIDKTEKKSKTTLKKIKNSEIIDRFIETNPKIIPNQNSVTKFVLNEKNTETSTLMTETLAQVYLKQKKYQKAIEAYEILILKYPKKSSFFADQINNIKKIQQNSI